MTPRHRMEPHTTGTFGQTPTVTLHWAIRLRLVLMVPWHSRWNRWVRRITARIEGQGRTN